MPGQKLRTTVLHTANELINGDRHAEYGDASENFRRIADMWSAYLGVRVRPVDVANMMVLLKVSREAHGKPKLDSYVDMAGYAALGAELMNNT